MTEIKIVSSFVGFVKSNKVNSQKKFEDAAAKHQASLKRFVDAVDDITDTSSEDELEEDKIIEQVLRNYSGKFAFFNTCTVYISR